MKHISSPRARVKSRSQRPAATVFVRSLRTFAIMSLACGTVAGSVLMFDQLNRPLTRVMIGGDFKYLNQNQVVEMLSDEIKGGFLSVDLNHVRQVIENHPWVDQAVVRRRWPSILEIEVAEEIPIARWGEMGFLNYRGKQLEVSSRMHTGKLPLLFSPLASSEQMMRQYQAFSQQLLPAGLRIERLDNDASGAWRVDTSAAIQLILGRDQVLQKLRRFVTVWDSGLRAHSASIERVDLRYPNGLAVGWKGPTLSGGQVLPETLMYGGTRG